MSSDLWVSNEEPEAPEEAPQSPRQAPASPNYVPGPEHPPSPDYVPGLEYPEYLIPSDDEVPIKDQPLPVDASPTALSPGYVADSDPSEEDLEEDPAEYPTDGGDDDDDEEEEEKDEEEEEHLASADSTTLLTVDPIPSAEDTEAFETDESAPIPTHTSPYAEAPLGYRAAMIRSRVASPSPIPSPRLRRAKIFVRPQSLMSAATEALIATDVPEADVPPQKRLCLTAPSPRFEVGESSAAAAARQPGLDVTHATDYSFGDTIDATLGRPMIREVGYGITDVGDDLVRDMEETAPTTLEAINQRVTDLATTLAQGTYELYVCCEDAQDDQALLRAQVYLLTRERRYFCLMASSYERKVSDARRAWAHSKSRNQAIEAQIKPL
ncbi:hypothetical protein Tco_0151710 [Tanacetum coccineum]